ncbi:MAG: hypothetical protein HY326_01195 [Chloroflexi bacterium]|nr:hypothetical protein [Chloroflexota bacterium]
MSRRRKVSPAAEAPSHGSMAAAPGSARRSVSGARPEINRDWLDDLLPRIWQAIRTEPWITAFSIFCGSRLALFLLPLLFIGLFPVADSQKPGFMQAFGNWDGSWYTGIATQGYSWQGPTTQSNIAFFPLYPLLGKIVGWVSGGPQVGLFLVSNISFLIYLYFLYRLATMDFEQETAYRALLYVAIFPLSFIFSSLYTESLMLALSTSAFFYARQGKWKLAISLAALTTLTRLAGLFILLPLAWEFYKQRGIKREAISLAAIPAGTACYVLFIWWLTGNPLSFSTVTSAAWFRYVTMPWNTLSISWQIVTDNHIKMYVTSIAIFDFAIIVTFLALSFLAIKWMKPSYWIYAIPASLFAISTTLDPSKGLATASLARYLMAVFPVFILLGLAGRNRFIHHAILFCFALLFGVFPIYFFSTVWVT